MGNSTFSHIIRFVVLMLSQGLIFNHLNLFGFITPYVYVMFILMLPLQINGLLLLFLAFATGLSIDLFTQTWGVHTCATLALAYVRPVMLNLIAPRDGYGFNLSPSLRTMGFVWTGVYMGVLTFFHHLVLFVVDMFRFSELGNLLGRTASTTLLTLILLFLFQLSGGIKSRRE
jgi:hypothetical protein